MQQNIINNILKGLLKDIIKIEKNHGNKIIKKDKIFFKVSLLYLNKSLL